MSNVRNIWRKEILIDISADEGSVLAGLLSLKERLQDDLHAVNELINAFQADIEEPTGEQ